jgi:hypothetical protein
VLLGGMGGGASAPSDEGVLLRTPFVRRDEASGGVG